jgi:hypothetical protein
MIEAKAFRTFIRLYSLFKSERLNANIKLTLHKALIRSVMTYACPAWEFAADLCSRLTREWPEEMSAADFENVKNVLGIHNNKTK